MVSQIFYESQICLWKTKQILKDIERPWESSKDFEKQWKTLREITRDFELNVEMTFLNCSWLGIKGRKVMIRCWECSN